MSLIGIISRAVAQKIGIISRAVAQKRRQRGCNAGCRRALEHQRATMNKIAIRPAATGGLLGALLLVASMTGALAQAQSAMHARSHVAQFCAPPEQGGGAPRFYCRNDQG
jgi:hypothetical protein